jgi:hypothetical protein
LVSLCGATSEAWSGDAEGDQIMPTLAAGCIKLELNAPAPGQTAQLAQQFVARHATWMTIDRRGVKAKLLARNGWRG